MRRLSLVNWTVDLQLSASKFEYLPETKVKQLSGHHFPHFLCACSALKKVCCELGHVEHVTLCHFEVDYTSGALSESEDPR